MPVTIRDVAKRLNLSITTVSRALDGYTDVAEATRLLVMHEAQEMGYIPNRAARQLRRKRTDTLGYILPAGSPSFADPFYSEFISGLGDEAALHESGFTVGGNLAVAGFDGIEAAAHTTPPLTTLNQPVYTIARQLVSMLMDLISGKPREVNRVTLKPELILRPSTTGFRL